MLLPSLHATPRREPRHSPVSIVRILVLFTVALGGAAIGSTIYALYLHERAKEAALSVRPPAPVPPPVLAPRAGLAWRGEFADAEECTTASEVPNETGPIEAKVDGATLYVGFLWLVGAPQDGLHVAAFDAVTLKPRWIAGPYPSASGDRRVPRHSLTVANDSVVLGDTDGTMRVLDAATGEERRAVAMPRRRFRACAEGALVRLVYEDHTARLFDPSTGRLTSTKQPPPSAPRWAPPPPVVGEILQRRRAPSGNFLAVLRGDGVHVLGLDAVTSAPRFDTMLARTGPATEIRGLSVIGDDVFVRTDAAMLVVDGRTGALRGRLEAL